MEGLTVYLTSCVHFVAEELEADFLRTFNTKKQMYEQRLWFFLLVRPGSYPQCSCPPHSCVVC